MHANAAHYDRIAPGASIAPAVAALHVAQWNRDMPLVSVPGPQVRLIVRFGPSARDGLDVHALGVRQTAHRKVVRAGQRTLTARLHLGAHEAVLGVPASAIAGQIVAIEDLWSNAAARRLMDRLAGARNTREAAAVLESAIAEKLPAPAAGLPAGAQLALAAVNKLTTGSVTAVALSLGVSERHLRRVFHETLGVSPKTFARLTRFRHALRVARVSGAASWASVATEAGYYDQAHLIAEFRAIAGVTPRALLAELGRMPTDP